MSFPFVSSASFISITQRPLDGPRRLRYVLITLPQSCAGAVSQEELSKHNSKESCWVAIKGKVIDVTGFLKDHPGGMKTLLKQGGKESTEVFEVLPLSSP